MSLRATLKAAVARCNPLDVQHATFAEKPATDDATSTQLEAANPHGITVSPATDHATGAQLTHETDATLGVELHVARTPGCNTQPGPLTAHRVEAALIEAAERASDAHGDGPEAREAMRRECLETPPRLQPDLLDHFAIAYPKGNP